MLNRLRKKEKGQALVEFALVLPLLIGLVCGIIDYGWLFYNYLSLQNACREGARKACVISSSDSYEDIVTEKVKQNLPLAQQDELNVTVEYTESNRVDGDVVVTAEAHVYFLTPVLGTVYKEENGGKVIKSTLVMKVES